MSLPDKGQTGSNGSGVGSGAGSGAGNVSCGAMGVGSGVDAGVSVGGGVASGGAGSPSPLDVLLSLLPQATSENVSISANVIAKNLLIFIEYYLP